MAEEYEFEPELEVEPEVEPEAEPEFKLPFFGKKKVKRARRTRGPGRKRSGWVEFKEMIKRLPPEEIKRRIRKSKSPRYRYWLAVYGGLIEPKKGFRKLRPVRKPKRKFRLW